MTGADRFRFLNGQTTNDVRKASPDATQESCVLNSKGHLNAHIFLFTVPSEIWIDTEAELREQLQGRLERYIIADDVLVEDASEGFALFHVLAEPRPEGAGARFCVRSDDCANRRMGQRPRQATRTQRYFDRLIFIFCRLSAHTQRYVADEAYATNSSRFSRFRK